MKYLAIILLSIALPAIGFAQQVIFGSISHDGMTRTYYLYEPASHTGITPVPLVLNYHGWGSTASQQMNLADFQPIADTAGFIFVCPQGTLFEGNTHWNVGGWTVGSTTDDVGFTENLIDSISSSYNIDSTRIYSTGFSNGGYMSFLLACQLGDRIAAIASVAGSMTPETFDVCSPTHPTPILQIHGTADGVVPYDGDTWTLPIGDAIQYWVDYDNCNDIPITTPLPDVDPGDGSTVEHVVHEDGDSGVTVEHLRVIGGAHDWPGAFGNMDISASEEIWKFFSRYDIDGLIGDSFLCGDADGSDGVDIDDVVHLIAYIFTGGTAPEPLESGDADCSGGVDIDDVVYLIAYIFSGGPAPCAEC